MPVRDFEEKTVVITRPIERAKVLSDIIESCNGRPVVVPTLELELVESQELIDICNNISSYDWIIFTSPAGVKSFFNTYKGGDVPCRIAVIGVKTEEELNKHNLEADLVPDTFTAEGLLEAFKDIDVTGKCIALPRTLSARTVLPEGLESYGARVMIAESYKSSIPHDASKILKLADDILNDNIDVLTFTSPLTAHNLFKLLKEHRSTQYEDILTKIRSDVIVASIGPITTSALKEYSISAVEPDSYTVKDMINNLLDYMGD